MLANISLVLGSSVFAKGMIQKQDLLVLSDIATIPISPGSHTRHLGTPSCTYQLN